MSELQKLVMAPGFKKDILSGAKRITIRDRHRPQFVEGETIEIVSANSDWGCLAVLTSVTMQTYATTSQEDIEDDGFADREDMMQGMRGFYPHIEAESPNTVIRWDEISELWEA